MKSRTTFLLGLISFGLFVAVGTWYALSHSRSTVQTENLQQVSEEAPPTKPMIAGSAQLPDDFPTTVPIPNDATVTGSFSSQGVSSITYIVAFDLGQSTNDAAQSYAELLRSAGFSVVDAPRSDDSPMVRGTRDAVAVSATFSSDTANSSATVLTLEVTQER